VISTIVIVTSSLPPCHCHFSFFLSFIFFERKLGGEVRVIRVGGERAGTKETWHYMDRWWVDHSMMDRTGGSWQLLRDFHRNIFSGCFSPSSIEVLSQCATCINKNGKKNQIKEAGSLLDMLFCPMMSFCVCAFKVLYAKSQSWPFSISLLAGIRGG